MIYVVSLVGVLLSNGFNIPIHLEFKNSGLCVAAKAALETKHPGAQLSCLEGTVHSDGGSLGNAYPIP